MATLVYVIAQQWNESLSRQISAVHIPDVHLALNRYRGIWKNQIRRNIDTGIRYELVYRSALGDGGAIQFPIRRRPLEGQQFI